MRLTAPAPDAFDLAQLAAESGATSCTYYLPGNLIAGRFDSEAPTEEEFQTLVAAHTPQLDLPNPEERITALETPPDREAATAVKAELQRLATDAARARTVAQQFRGSNSTQKNNIVAATYDEFLESVAQLNDTMARVIRATVRD